LIATQQFDRARARRAIGQWLESQAHNMNKIHAQRLRIKRQ
jgi:hypothetical protein